MVRHDLKNVYHRSSFSEEKALWSFTYLQKYRELPIAIHLPGNFDKGYLKDCARVETNKS